MFIRGIDCCEFEGACNVAARYRGDFVMLLRFLLSYGSRRQGGGSSQVEVSLWLCAECEERP